VSTSLRRLIPLLLVAALPAAASGQQRDEVFIYYANETAPDEVEAMNYATMQAWFRGSTDPKQRQIADYLEEDRLLFQAATDVEMGDLTRGPARALFFTNRLVRRAKCLKVLPGRAGPVELPFAVPPDPNYILTSNPLSKVETLAAALALAAREFPPERHEFVLVVKSHGNAKKVITPRWIVRAEETTREEMLAVAAGTHPGPPPAWAGRLGFGKPEFLGVLAASGLHFALVDVEACGTDTQEFGREHLPENVDRLMHIRKGAGKINLLWGDMKRDLRPGERFWESMLRHRTPKFIVVEWASGTATNESAPTRAPRPFPWWYFMPLGVWVGWVIGYHVRRRAEPIAGADVGCPRGLHERYTGQ
jgi:hypothetical protein